MRVFRIITLLLIIQGCSEEKGQKTQSSNESIVTVDTCGFNDHEGCENTPVCTESSEDEVSKCHREINHPDFLEEHEEWMLSLGNGQYYHRCNFDSNFQIVHIYSYYFMDSAVCAMPLN